MIQLIDDRPGHVLEGDEVDYVVVLVKSAFHLDRGSVIVTVNPLATISVIGDEMTRAEDQIILGHPNLEARRRHGDETPMVMAGGP
jgi:hypothetical protein